MKEYRELLQKMESEAQEQYDNSQGVTKSRGQVITITQCIS